MAVDPMPMPRWVAARYEEAGIEFLNIKAEELSGAWLPSTSLIFQNNSTRIFDEVWLYNVLQHTEDPAKIVQNARSLGKIIRVFDWLEIGVAPGHPQNLTEIQMNEWFGGEGKVEMGDGGLEYFGVFKGDNFNG
jgi:hypothetical protein